MKKFILGKKLGMTTLYEKGKALNVTLVECAPNKISGILSKEKNGYQAVLLEIAKTKKHLKRKEFRVDDEKDFEINKEISVGIFEEGEKVKISGVSKSKGFQGGMKRHHFSGSSRTHGHKHDWRAPGSIGSQDPQRVFKGMRMAGRMGGKRSSTLNLKVVLIDTEKNLLGVEGAVPGIPGSIVEIFGLEKK